MQDFIRADLYEDELVEGGLTSVYDGESSPSRFAPLPKLRGKIEPSFKIWEDTPKTKRDMTVPSLDGRIVTFVFGDDDVKISWDGHRDPSERNGAKQMLVLKIPGKLKAHLTAEQAKELKEKGSVEGVPVEYYGRSGELPTTKEISSHVAKLKRRLKDHPEEDFTTRAKWERELQLVGEGKMTAARWRSYEAALTIELRPYTAVDWKENVPLY